MSILQCRLTLVSAYPISNQVSPGNGSGILPLSTRSLFLLLQLFLFSRLSEHGLIVFPPIPRPHLLQFRSGFHDIHAEDFVQSSFLRLVALSSISLIICVIGACDSDPNQESCTLSYWPLRNYSGCRHRFLSALLH